jgi:hypothetical protein
MHIRHHLDRADLACFDFKRLVKRVPILGRTLEALEWAYLPAIELLMHLQLLIKALGGGWQAASGAPVSS